MGQIKNIKLHIVTDIKLNTGPCQLNSSNQLPLGLCLKTNKNKQTNENQKQTEIITMAGMLFACTKCHSRHPFEELSKEEQLCKGCQRKYPLVPCQYCQIDFHMLKKSDGKPTCTKCTQHVSSYGAPKPCKYCQMNAAFKASYCARCISSRKRYGEPVNCHTCKKRCAFNKGAETRTKLGGLILCLRCTMDFKKRK